MADQSVQIPPGGNVTGPILSTDNASARYDGTSGFYIQNSVVTLADDGTLSVPAIIVTSGIPNTPPYLDSLVSLTSLPNWSVNEWYGTNNYLTVNTPVDAGDVYAKIIGYEFEINPAVTTAQFHPIGVNVDIHFDRTGSGFDMNDMTAWAINSTHEGNGIIQNYSILSIYSSAGVGANTGTITNLTAMPITSNVGAGFTVDNLMGINFNSVIDPTAAVDHGTLLTGGVTGSFTNNYTILNLGLTGDAAGGLTLFNLYHNGTTPSGHVNGINLSLSNASDTTGKSLFSGQLGGGTSSGGGRFFELSAGNGDYGNFIGANFNHSSITSTGETCINIGKSSADTQNYIGINYGTNGDATSSFTGILMSSYPTSTQNYNGLVISPGGGTASNSVFGINVSLSNMGYTGYGFPSAIQSNGGSLVANYDVETGAVTTFPLALFSLHNLSTNFKITSGSPLVAAGPLTPPFGFGNNFSSTFWFQDDYDADFTGARIGYSLMGSLGQVAGDLGKTADTFNLMLLGASIPSLSTGGTITDASGLRVVGIVPDGGGGTLAITNLYGVKIDSIFSLGGPSNAWGIFVDDASAENYFKKSVIISDSQNQVSNSSVALEVKSAKAFLPPRLTTAERNALTPLAGMFIFNTDDNELQYYDAVAVAWQSIVISA